MYKQNSTLNNLQGLICNKNQPTSGEPGISLSSFVHHLYNFSKIIQNCWIVPVILCCHGTKCDTLLWLPHAFPGSLFINSLCAHAVFKTSTQSIWNFFWQSGLFIRASCLAASNSKTRKTLLTINYLLKCIVVRIIHPIYL